MNGAPIDPLTGKPGSFKPLIPAIAGLTAECKTVVVGLGLHETAAWTRLEQECTALGLDPNIESILGRIRSKLDALTDPDSLHNLTHSKWEAVDDAIRQKIAELATPPLPVLLPHHDFAKWARSTTRRQPIEIFTTNYDVLFESTFDELCVPHFDGFVGSQNPYFSAETVENDSLLPSPTWARFWKLHGSVSWSLETVGGKQRITRGRPSKSGEMVLPSHRKYDESRKQPYRALMDRLARVLAREDSLVIACGFSFSDQHINAIFLDALQRRPRTHLIAISYEDINADHHVSKWATDLNNIVHLGPNGATVSGRFGDWETSRPPDAALTAATGGLAIPDPKDATRVRMTGGDFGAFCGYLATFGGA